MNVPPEDSEETCESEEQRARCEAGQKDLELLLAM
jgi:hypothetical protein